MAAQQQPKPWTLAQVAVGIAVLVGGYYGLKSCLCGEDPRGQKCDSYTKACPKGFVCVRSGNVTEGRCEPEGEPKKVEGKAAPAPSTAPAPPAPVAPVRPPLPQLCDEIRAVAAGLEERRRELATAFGRFSGADELGWGRWSHQFNRDLAEFRSYEDKFKAWGLHGLADGAVEKAGGSLLGAGAALSVLWGEYDQRMKGRKSNVPHFTREVRDYLNKARRLLASAKCK
jgi:hypothetical protein